MGGEGEGCEEAAAQNWMYKMALHFVSRFSLVSSYPKSENE